MARHDHKIDNKYASVPKWSGTGYDPADIPTSGTKPAGYDDLDEGPFTFDGPSGHDIGNDEA